jgi:tetratricopeptide (TPR) repeat protein
MGKKEKNKKDKGKESSVFRNPAERFSKQIGDLLSGKEFSSKEEIQKFLKDAVDKYEDFEPPEKTPLDKAQDLVYDAWESDEEEAVRLAKEALKISPDCADAYVILAEATEDVKKALKLYEKGIKAGERVLGKDFLEDEENIGHFWGMVSTRPYMRAKYGYAECLWALGRKEEALEHFKDMLRLNPNDNQGVRYTLINYFIVCDRDTEAWELLKKYNEYSAFWVYSRALLTFRKEGKSAIADTLLQNAFKVNKYVAEILTGERKISESSPRAYSPGSIQEAEIYARHALDAWSESENSFIWISKVYEVYKRRN